MLDLAKHIVETKSADFEPEKFEDRYENALVELLNQKRKGEPPRTAVKSRDTGNVVNLMDALRKSLDAGGKANADADRNRPSNRGRRPVSAKCSWRYPEKGMASRRPPPRKRSGLPDSARQVSTNPSNIRKDDMSIDDRHRDKDGEISRKHGNTLVSTLRRNYGPSFAAG